MGLISKLREMWRRHDEKLTQHAYGDREGVERLDQLHSQQQEVRGPGRVGDQPQRG
jgi:hypothetical protein